MHLLGTGEITASRDHRGETGTRRGVVPKPVEAPVTAEDSKFPLILLIGALGLGAVWFFFLRKR